MPIQAALLLIRAISCQTIRGTGSIIAGVLTCDPFKVGSGFKDYISVIVQAIALPVIALVAPFSPDAANLILKGFLTHSFESAKDTEKLHKHFASQSENVVTRQITGLVRGIVGVPVSIIDGLTVGVSSILRGRIGFGLSSAYKGCVIQSLFTFLHIPLASNQEVYSGITGIATHEILF